MCCVIFCIHCLNRSIRVGYDAGSHGVARDRWRRRYKRRVRILVRARGILFDDIRRFGSNLRLGPKLVKLHTRRKQSVLILGMGFRGLGCCVGVLVVMCVVVVCVCVCGGGIWLSAYAFTCVQLAHPLGPVSIATTNYPPFPSWP